MQGRNRSDFRGRQAGASQGFAVIVLAALPTMAIVSLVPNLPLLFQTFGHVPNAGLLVPMILTVPSLCIALFSPVLGAVSDRRGRRAVLIPSLLVFVGVGVLPVFMSNLTAVLMTRFAVGVAEAGIMATHTALLGDYFEGERRERWLGTLSLITPIVATVMVLAGGALGTISWHAPFLLYILGAPMLVWTLFSLYEPENVGRPRVPGDSRADAFPWQAATLVGVVTLAVSVLFYVQAVQLGRVFGEYGVTSPAQIGLYITVTSIGAAVGGWVYPRTSGFTPSWRFGLILLAYAIGYTGLGLSRSVAGAMPAALVAQFGNGMAIPVLIGWSLGHFEPRHRGTGMGTWASAFFAGTFLSSPVVSLAQSIAGSFLGAVVGMGVVSGVAAIVVLAFSARSRPRAA